MEGIKLHEMTPVELEAATDAMSVQEIWFAIGRNEKALPGDVDADSIEMYIAGYGDNLDLIRAIESLESRNPAVRTHIHLLFCWHRAAKAVA